VKPRNQDIVRKVFAVFVLTITALLWAVLPLDENGFGWPQMVVAVLWFLSVVFVLKISLIAEPNIERPDVLGTDRHTTAIMNALDQAPDEGVFCGHIETPEGLRSAYISTEDRGVVIGPPGTGKSAFMVTQMLDWSKSRRSIVCLDIKPELHDIMRARLEKQGYRIRIFNPTAPCDRYNMLDDLVGTTAIGELAASLIPSAGGDNRAFDEAARDIVDGLISYLKVDGQAVSLPAIRHLLGGMANEKELVDMLASSEDEDVRDIAFALARSGRNSRFLGAVFATLRSNLRFLRYEEIRTSIEVSDFSLRELMDDDRPTALFLQFEERHQETTRLLLSAMVAHLFNFFIEHTERKPVLLMLDEIGNVPRIPALVEKLNTIRSRQLPTWLYWQGIQQMQQYGMQRDEGPNSILAACDFHMAFRLNDNDTARWFSDRIGTADRIMTSVSQSGSGETLSKSVKEEPIMKLADLQSLPNGQSIAIYRGNVWRNLATPYFKRWPQMARKPNSNSRQSRRRSDPVS